MNILHSSINKISISNISINQSQSIDIFMNKQKQINIKCTNNNKAIELCTNQKCKSDHIFTCGEYKCKCKEDHKLCLKADLYAISEIISQKIHKTDDFKSYIEDIIQKIINYFSQLRQKLIKQIDSDIKYTRLHQIQRQLLQFIYQNPQKNNQKSFKSTHSALLWKIINNKQEQSSKIFQDTKKLLNKLQTESKQSVDNVNSSLKLLIQKQKQNKNTMLHKLDKSIKQQLTTSQKAIAQVLMSKSSICKTNEYSLRLIRFFPKKLKKIELLFKASENGFKLAKFYDICGAATHTIILCQSNKGKIVGGYTPFCYYPLNLANDQWVQDPLKQSFMFSLSNNDKFFLNYKAYAIYLRKNKECIQFGGNQIQIYDNANTASNNYLRCNSYYINQNYSNGDKQSYLSFNGNQTLQCSISEYEVWRVQYQ